MSDWVMRAGIFSGCHQASLPRGPANKVVRRHFAFVLIPGLVRGGNNPCTGYCYRKRLLIPVCFYKFNKNYGEKYRKNLATFRSFYNETITSQNQIITNNKISIISKEADKRTNNLLFDNKKIDRNNNIFRNITLFVITILNISIVLVGYALTNQGLFIN